MTPAQLPGKKSRAERLEALILRRGKLAPDEAALLRAVFVDIFQTHRREVAAQIRRRVDNEATVKDLLQDVFIALHLLLLEKGFPDNMGAYLHTITLRKISNHHRVHKRSPRSIEVLSSGLEAPRTGPDAERTIDIRTLAPQLLGMLSEEQRDVVIRLVVLHQPFAEVAKLLDIPAPTLKSRLMAAKRRLYELALPLLPPSQRRV